MFTLLEAVVVAELMSANTDTRTAAEQHCLVENVIYEASNQGVEGLRLATEIAMNRLAAGHRQKHTQCGVIYDPKQFSWTSTPPENRRAYTEAEYKAAAQVVYTYYYGEEVSRLLPEDVLFYINPRTATDLSWYDKSKVVYVHKDHHFVKL